MHIFRAFLLGFIALFLMGPLSSGQTQANNYYYWNGDQIIEMKIDSNYIPCAADVHICPFATIEFLLTPLVTISNYYPTMVIRKRLQISGKAIVFVTTTVADWKPLFTEPEMAKLCLNQLQESLRYCEVSLIGYVLMPHHLHLLLGFYDIGLLSRFMQSFKILSSKKIKESLQGRRRIFPKDNFHLWKPRFDDLIIVSEEQFRIKLDYIHNNPVKAGIVSEITDYPYSSARDWNKGETGMISIDKDFGWTA
jgi:putative transposase